MLRRSLALLLLASPHRGGDLSPAPVPGSEMQMLRPPGGQPVMEVVPASFPPWSPDFSDGFLPGSESEEEEVDDENSAPAPGVDLTVPLQ